MESLPTNWSTLAAVVFLLGMRHGFDADHIATINGLTRMNARAKKPFAQFCGALFSLGHGVVVITIAVIVSLAAAQWQTPSWLETSGVWISTLFLIVLGVVNIRAVVIAPAEEIIMPIGLKSRLIGKLARANSPATVTLVGALFALSLDTISQAALFSLTAQQYGGLGYGAALGFIFMSGMLVTDGINGLWISRMIARADEIGRIASRVMSLAIGGVSLIVAGFSLTKLKFPSVSTWTGSKEIFIGIALITVMLLSLLTARRLTRGQQST